MNKTISTYSYKYQESQYQTNQAKPGFSISTKKMFVPCEPGLEQDYAGTGGVVKGD